MSTTLHKILIHSANVINSSLLPIEQLSEEAQEARNKDCRRYRQHHSRKNSREAMNRDLLTMLLVTSDPIISSLRNVPSKNSNTYPREVLNLLASPPINIHVPDYEEELYENYSKTGSDKSAYIESE
ncbi:uncharacterized protein LOC119672298 isoform X1 [Teleopsis dalmanni]|uniref:uncharacterized protein LOC119671878 n=1 Tax=Teleopsis dalmanni TaxID=139649 RepID=UPI0018CCBBE8|nr:uncharacterized protein LOC119671878 [Teleopsis dalmanni]XP_037939246.1 uncharacterized protein LOC119672298 isoform X1 [Teleopsis dalmanni]